MGKDVTEFSINEPTYTLSIDDFDPRGDLVFEEGPVLKRGGKDYY